MYLFLIVVIFKLYGCTLLSIVKFQFESLSSKIEQALKKKEKKRAKKGYE